VWRVDTDCDDGCYSEVALAGNKETDVSIKRIAQRGAV